MDGALKEYDVKQATIKDIRYSIGRYGIVTPIVIFDKKIPILKIGDNVMTSDNIAIVSPGIHETDDIGVGTTVDVVTTSSKYTQQGIMSILHELKKEPPVQGTRDTTSKSLIPRKCPICDSVIRECAGQYACVNIACPAGIYQRCSHFARSVGIHLHGVYHNILATLIARKLIKTPLDIFTTSDATVLDTLDNISEKHLNLYKALISDVVGKISMTQLITGLDMIPFDSPDEVRNFVVKMSDKDIFNIETLIKMVIDETYSDSFVSMCGIGLADLDELSANGITDILVKMDTVQYELLNERFGNIGAYRMAYLFSFILNDTNREMLESMHNIDLIEPALCAKSK